MFKHFLPALHLFAPADFDLFNRHRTGSPGSHDFFFPSMITDPRNETSCIEKIFYETMPAEKVKIVERLGLKFFPDGDGKETFV